MARSEYLDESDCDPSTVAMTEPPWLPVAPKMVRSFLDIVESVELVMGSLDELAYVYGVRLVDV
jgi:hypothetical protein